MVLPVVRVSDGQRELCDMRCGFIPSWWDKGQPPQHTINATIENVAKSGMWRSALKHTRYLVPSLGWYEWKDAGTRRRKQPYFIHLPSKEPFLFAGLWAEWRGKESEPLLTFATLTRDAAGSIKSIHDRMPLVVAPDAYYAWSDPKADDGTDLCAMVETTAVTEFEAYPVSTYVNSPKNQGEKCVKTMPTQ
jgi:putative SOS response-associated peptidase YedK